MESPQNETILEILTTFKNWAVVGASQNSSRPSSGVLEYLGQSGYSVIPINPNYSEVNSLKCYPSLTEAAKTVEIEVVDVFRRADDVMGITLEAIEIGAKAIWFQLGVINYEAVEVASASGLQVVMDRCPRIEIPKLKLD
ncbi:MAG: CoA-binding protein [Actinobacteria bacterium]|nr:CoA-binding protein [Actinomycetota bacterium]